MDLVINISVSHGCVDFVQFLAAEIMTDSCVLYTASTIGTVLGSALTRSLFVVCFICIEMSGSVKWCCMIIAGNAEWWCVDYVQFFSSRNNDCVVLIDVRAGGAILKSATWEETVIARGSGNSVIETKIGTETVTRTGVEVGLHTTVIGVCVVVTSHATLNDVLLHFIRTTLWGRKKEPIFFCVLLFCGGACALCFSEWWGASVVICLDRCADLHMAHLMSLPLRVSCFSKIQIGFTFLVPAHLGSPGQRAVKWVCVCVCVCFSFNTWQKLVDFFIYIYEHQIYNSVYLILAFVKNFA